MKFDRLINLITIDKYNKLSNSKILVVGVGGVGGYVCEMLARCGVTTIGVVDSDVVSETNINRQIIALTSTLNISKVEVIKSRLKDINNDINVIGYDIFIDEANLHSLNLETYDYVIDCIDTVKSKLALIEYCVKNNIKIISSMGTGNKLDVTKFKICDISKTHTCPLAKVVRYELRKRGINHLKVLFSEEIPSNITKFENGRNIPASFAPAVATAGIMISANVINEIIGE